MPLSTAIAAGIAALLLIWILFRVSIANALLDTRPNLAVGLAAWNPEILLEPLDDAMLASQILDPSVEKAGIKVLNRAPLAEEPLLVAAAKARNAGDTKGADQLILAAHRRNPRSRYALLLLLDTQLHQGRINEAALSVATLSRLMPNASELLVSQLAKLAVQPETREAIRGVIRTHPEMRNKLLEHLAGEGADPDIILDLAGEADNISRAATPRWQKMVLQSLVARGQVARARQLWSGFTGTSLPEGIYDPDFTGMPGPAPFNWTFFPGAEGLAEPTKGSPGLYVEYYARRDAKLAEQLIMLPPGRYSLRLRTDGETASEASEGGSLAWTLVCGQTGREIARVPLTGIDTNPKAIEAVFTIPAGCSAQWLRLGGKFAEFPKDQHVTIRDLRIAKVDKS